MDPISSRRALLMGGGAMALTGAAEPRQDVCAPYYGRGYCTDYVNGRTGRRQRGDADTWPSNMPADQAQAGDVAIFRRIKHVAYVEAVLERDASGRSRRVRISEMNYGPRNPNTPRECYVTMNFNVRTEREITVTEAEFMRPGGYSPRPPAEPARPRVPRRRRYG